MKIPVYVVIGGHNYDHDIACLSSSSSMCLCEPKDDE